MIKRSDLDELRSRANIVDVVGDYVSLKRAGVDSFKGLCPFHDEKSPSFHVRPGSGYFNCFGCGEKGDMYAFLQKIDHLSFVEAAERIAQRVGFTLTYEDGGAQRDTGQRARLLEANKAAEEFFVAQLTTPDAALAHDFLSGRGFDPAACAQFRVGYAPNSYDALSKHLLARKFTEQELEAAGLVSRGDRGTYDRFRGRVMWPIRDTTGTTVGFGARRLRDDDKGPKYLNTPDTPVYHKSKVLYGIDLAKRSIGRDRRVVVVEGYTDVMACHLAGITSAVATCGTAFGPDHVSLIRRILGDMNGVDNKSRGEVIFTFDPDEAGQKAATKAFAEDSKFAANTFVAVAPDGLDPCDLRIQRGDASLVEVINSRKPMFEFMIRRAIATYNLETVEGRVGAVRAAGPILAGIRDTSVVDGYVRMVAGWIGVDPADVRAGFSRGSRDVVPASARPVVANADAPTARSFDRNPVARLERDALAVVLQYPTQLGIERAGDVVGCRFTFPILAAVRDAIVASFAEFGSPNWVATVEAAVPEILAPLVVELSLIPLPIQTVSDPITDGMSESQRELVRRRNAEQTEVNLRRYVSDVANSLVDRNLAAAADELMGRLARLDAAENPAAHRDIQQQLVAIHDRRRQLKGD
ncbi:DNA primase [Microbacteriaceae bacterium MWH-Ta3]|nr:DNA primase [Microbacteriaceae bacterium MWH-Ta3]